MQQKGKMCNRIVLKVGDKFKFIYPKLLRKNVYLYCGKVLVNDTYKSLVYVKTPEGQKNRYSLLSLDYFKNGSMAFFREIEKMQQNDVQFEASRRMARKRKKKWIDENIQEDSNRNRPKL